MTKRTSFRKQRPWTALGTYPHIVEGHFVHVINFKRVQSVSDIWAMGATCYVLLTGTYPRELQPGQDPLLAILQEECIPICERAPHIPAGIAEVIDRSLATKEGERYHNGREMYEALLKAWEDLSERRLRPS